MRAPLIASVVAAVVYGLGSVLQSAGAKRGGGTPGAKGLLCIARDQLYLAGLGCDFVGWLLMVYAVRHLPLFAVQTVLAGSLVVTSALGWAVLDARLRRADLVTMAVSIIGLGLVGTAASLDSPADRHGAVSMLLLIWCPVALVVGVALSRTARPVTVAAAAGLLFSLGATSIRTIETTPSIGDLVMNPLAWVVVIYSVAALALHARALEGGRVGPVTAATWSTEIVVGSTLGFVLLGDQVREGAGWRAVIGIMLSVGATVALANSTHANEAVPALPEPTPAR